MQSPSPQIVLFLFKRNREWISKWKFVFIYVISIHFFRYCKQCFSVVSCMVTSTARYLTKWLDCLCACAVFANICHVWFRVATHSNKETTNEPRSRSDKSGDNNILIIWYHIAVNAFVSIQRKTKCRNMTPIAHVQHISTGLNHFYQFFLCFLDDWSIYVSKMPKRILFSHNDSLAIVCRRTEKTLWFFGTFAFYCGHVHISWVTRYASIPFDVFPFPPSLILIHVLSVGLTPFV